MKNLKKIVLVLTFLFLAACVNSTVSIDGTYVSNEVDEAEIKIEEDKITVISQEYEGIVSIYATLKEENTEDSENVFYFLDQDSLLLEHTDPMLSEFGERDEYVKNVEHQALLNNYNQDFIDMMVEIFDLFVIIDENGENRMGYHYDDMRDFLENYSYLESYSDGTEEIFSILREGLDYMYEYSEKFDLEAIVKDNEVKAIIIPFSPKYPHNDGTYTFFRK